MSDRFFKAVRDGDIQTVQAELKRNPDLAKQWDDFSGNPAFVSTTDADICDLLIQHGADVHERCVDDMTPLHIAARQENVNIVPVLLRHGADLNEANEMGYSPLVYAVLLGTGNGQKIVEYLLRAGARYDLTPAVIRGDLPRVREILAKDTSALLGMPLAEKKTMLMGLALIGAFETGNVGTEHDRLAIVKLLFDTGLDIDANVIRDLAARTPKEMSDVLKQYFD